MARLSITPDRAASTLENLFPDIEVNRDYKKEISKILKKHVIRFLEQHFIDKFEKSASGAISFAGFLSDNVSFNSIYNSLNNVSGIEDSYLKLIKDNIIKEVPPHFYIQKENAFDIDLNSFSESKLYELYGYFIKNTYFQLRRDLFDLTHKETLEKELLSKTIEKYINVSIPDNLLSDSNLYDTDIFKSFFNLRLDYLEKNLFSYKYFKEYSFAKRNNKAVREVELFSDRKLEILAMANVDKAANYLEAISTSLFIQYGVNQQKLVAYNNLIIFILRNLKIN